MTDFIHEERRKGCPCGKDTVCRDYDKETGEEFIYCIFCNARSEPKRKTDPGIPTLGQLRNEQGEA